MFIHVRLYACVCTYGEDGWNKGEMKRGKWKRRRREMKSRKLEPGVNGKVFLSFQLALVQGEPWNLAREREFLLTKSHRLLWLLCSFPHICFISSGDQEESQCYRHNLGCY